MNQIEKIIDIALLGTEENITNISVLLTIRFSE